MSFTEKRLRVTLKMANGVFANGSNTLVLENLRTTAEITITGGRSQGTAEVAIYGMNFSDMAAITNVGTRFQSNYDNTIKIEAGDLGGTMSIVYAGNILTAYFDGNSMPQTCLRVSASTTAYNAQAEAEPTSTTGSTDVATIVKSLASQIGLGFENAGVNTKLSPSYYSGSPWAQIRKICQDAGIEYCNDRGTLVITKPGTARSGDPILISPENGLIGYPTFNGAWIGVSALFTPLVRWQGQVKIQSSIQAACGTFKVNKLSYSLEAMVPNGRWVMELACYADPETAP